MARTESAFAKTHWTCETTKPFSHDETITGPSHPAPPTTVLSLHHHRHHRHRRHHRKDNPHGFKEKTCPDDPAQADFNTQCGSTWPEMAFLSHPQLSSTARELLSPVPCVLRRRIIMHRTSCLCQPAPWPPRCRHPPPPPRPELPAPLHPEIALCPLHLISIDRRRPRHMVGQGAPPGGVGVMVLGVEVSLKVLLAQRSLLCRCGRCGELKSRRPLLGHLPTLNVGKMWVHI